jgi:hypothetical protein
MLAAYLMFFALQRRAEPVTTSFVGYVSMITGTAVGAAAFGERLPAIAWPALALIAGSMWLLKRPASDVAATSIERHDAGAGMRERPLLTFSENSLVRLQREGPAALRVEAVALRRHCLAAVGRLRIRSRQAGEGVKTDEDQVL